MSDVALTVTSVMPQLREHLNARAKEAIERNRLGTSPEMFAFGRVASGVPHEEFYRDFADRLNRLFAAIDGKNSHPFNGNRVMPCADATLSTPMSIPLADGRTAVVLHVFVYDLPFWSWSYSPVTGRSTGTFDTEAARAWLNERVGSILVAAREGEIPINSEDLK